jgi:hypothetical protein
MRRIVTAPSTVLAVLHTTCPSIRVVGSPVPRRSGNIVPARSTGRSNGIGSGATAAGYAFLAADDGLGGQNAPITMHTNSVDLSPSCGLGVSRVHRVGWST